MGKDSGFTHFGFDKVRASEKAKKVADVFNSVSANYDIMNDLMSLGTHRILKRIAANQTKLQPGEKVLDLAGGTGDMALLLHRIVSPSGTVFICDINQNMLRKGRERLVDKGIISGTEYVQADGEKLSFKKNSFDAITVSFGIRNFTNKKRALESMLEVLDYGGRLVILEFSRPTNPKVSKAYNSFSGLWPKLGKLIAGDESSYKYLVESIQIHPDQETMSGMISQAGFKNVECLSLLGGIVAIHSALKTR
ncbi:class I SAM-dependent methyltransferase [Gammaproteobacteria bacterium]|nr:class I SAM-dependent methyltransferase [Gammaproteobacteria bacterium]